MFPPARHCWEPSTGETLASVAISPDGATVAAGTFRGVIEVIVVATGQVVATLDYDDPDTATVSELAYSPDGSDARGRGLRASAAARSR
jgi:WD40 repeat protein